MSRTLTKPTTQILETVPFGTSPDEVAEIVRRDGGVILENALNPSQVAAINADIDAAMAAVQFGSRKDNSAYQAFHGARTKRLTNVITLSRTFREEFVDNPATLAYVSMGFKDVCDTYWLNASQAIEIHPGEKAQPLHRDMANYPIFFRYGPSGPEVMQNMLLALSDCNEEAGATRLIPGSHTWEFKERGSPEMTVPAVMKAGSAFFFGGKVIHGGGANTTRAVKRRVIATGFNPGFMVPEEAYPFVVPMEVARQMSPTLQQLIGFRSFHQYRQGGGSLWQHNYEELADYLEL